MHPAATPDRGSMASSRRSDSRLPLFDASDTSEPSHASRNMVCRNALTKVVTIKEAMRHLLAFYCRLYCPRIFCTVVLVERPRNTDLEAIQAMQRGVCLLRRMAIQVIEATCLPATPEEAIEAIEATIEAIEATRLSACRCFTLFTLLAYLNYTPRNPSQNCKHRMQCMHAISG